MLDSRKVGENRSVAHPETKSFSDSIAAELSDGNIGSLSAVERWSLEIQDRAAQVEFVEEGMSSCDMPHGTGCRLSILRGVVHGAIVSLLKIEYGEWEAYEGEINVERVQYGLRVHERATENPLISLESERLEAAFDYAQNAREQSLSLWDRLGLTNRVKQSVFTGVNWSVF